MTGLDEILDALRVPVVGAPMAGAAGGRLASAISAGGGLGLVGVGNTATVEQVRSECEIAARSGERFGAGLMCWSLPQNPALLDVVLEFEPVLLSLSFGDPRPYLPKVRETGAAVVAQVGTRTEALDALDAGVDGLVVRGSEGGGHGRGVVSTLPLLQQILDLTDRPVLVGGGVATARGLAAVLAAGAAAGWVGTPFAACEESLFRPELKEAVIEADTDQTVYTRAFDIAQRFDWPTIYGGRALANAFTDEWAERTDALETAVTEDFTARMKQARVDADVSLAPVYAGESAGLVDRPRTAAEVLAAFEPFREHLRSAQRWL
ncbi:putative oxidoreductase [Gordonia araii NBRC 100433]|uniref:Putative oxidoreductase n=1 Tax=Gordonia araii NBRC 100433 TaxID=1073574 RepID=G7H745_9ACTN|nr:nitronate monooxygenase [Gordonia araii]NNG97666.1 nitronate monooxygenase [Gordonia araii NBRC 100433]GAB11670.1 putative oxidoreductase [Gordonia araii NBRC 100433]